MSYTLFKSTFVFSTFQTMSHSHKDCSDRLSQAPILSYLIWFFVLYLLPTRTSSTTNICYTSPSPAEVESLLNLYNSTAGAHWENTWPVVQDANNPCNHWYGVQCVLNEGKCVVQNVQLQSNNLVGYIPESIGNLTQLQILNLQKNRLTGSIPSLIGELSQLFVFVLDSNQLTGNIPSSLVLLSKLKDLYLNNNQLTGSIPSSIGQLSQLQLLELYSNQLTGSIPSSIGQLSQLQLLELYSNQLTGSIPSSIGQLSQLQLLELYSNQLTGSIPSSIGQLSQLQLLELYSNQLTGSIPSSLGQLLQLESLKLGYNQLTGSIPSSLGQLSQLQYLELYSNQLTGSIPSSIGQLSQLQLLELYSNQLTGSIPSSIGQLLELLDLYLYSNKLTGNIPSSIGGLVRLQFLFVNENQLTGSLPTSFANMTSLFSFFVSDSLITIDDVSVFPSSLRFLDISGCFQRGKIPKELLSRLFGYLDMSYNLYSGSLPVEIWNTSVVQLFLNDNYINGTFPSKPASVTCSMQSVVLSGNFLSGRLPAQLSDCALLSQFQAANMSLSGSVEGLFGSQTNLSEVVLANNRLTGRMEDVFRNSSASKLILNAAFNQFTGSLPVSSLSTGRYSTLILTQNCLSGSLSSEELCANVNMTYLLLSGLHSASTCRSTMWSSGGLQQLFPTSYLQSPAFGGSLPACVLSLPQLVYLALSGNHFTGTLTDSISLAGSLQGLDLSHNQLVGTIPEAIFHANLTLLDLSFNRLSGTIPISATNYYAVSNTSQVSLQVNALSGSLPESWKHAIDINVLEGNLFACQEGSLMKTANIPINDNSSAHYACGSSSTNVALLTTVIVGISCIAAFYWLLKTSDKYNTSLSFAKVLHNCIGLISEKHSRFLLYLATCCLLMVLCMVMYSSVAVFHRTYSYMYIWAVSLSLQQGVTTGVILFVWLSTVSYCLIALSVPFQTTTTSRTPQTQQHRKVMLVGALLLYMTDLVGNINACGARLLAKSVLLVLMHVLPVFALNLLYVYTTTLSLSTKVRLVIVMGMSLFKLGWNSMMNMWMMTRLANTTPRSVDEEDDISSWLYALLRYVGLFNLVVAPLLTEVLVSPNCFQYLFTAIPVSSYAVDEVSCYEITNSQTTGSSTTFTCSSYEELQQTYNSGSSATGGNYDMAIVSTSSSGQSSTIDFQAGFAYNYQCTFSLLQVFVYVFVYRYLFGMFVLPLMWQLLKRLQSYGYAKYSASSVLCRLTTRLLPSLMKIYDDDDYEELLLTSMNVASSSSTLSPTSSMSCGATSNNNHQMLALETVLRNETYLCQLEAENRVKINVQLFSMRICGDIAVALSFGILFPPLGLLALGSVVSEVWWTRWMLNRLRCQSNRTKVSVATGFDVDGNHNSHCNDSEKDVNDTDVTTRELAVARQRHSSHVLRLVEQMEQSIAVEVSRCISEVPRILYFAVLLWAFALYDIVGREAGAVQSLWVLVLVLTMPLWSWYLVRAGQQSCLAISRAMFTSSSKEAIDSNHQQTAGDGTTTKDAVLEMTENPLVVRKTLDQNGDGISIPVQSVVQEP